MAVTINGSTGVAGVDGSASTPALQGTDTNTGIAFPAADTVSVATGGSERMRVDSSGRLGVNTASPLAFIQAAGSSSVAAANFNNVVEPATVSATAATGTINYDVCTQSVLYYTSNASANWTVNLRGSSGTSLNTLMSTNDVITVSFLVTQGTTAYYNNSVTVDGASVTPKYQGGTAWSSGNVSGIDVYTYTIIKTASATFTILASQTPFK